MRRPTGSLSCGDCVRSERRVIHKELAPVQEAALIGGEEQRRTRDLVRVPGAANPCLCPPVLSATTQRNGWPRLSTSPVIRRWLVNTRRSDWRSAPGYCVEVPKRPNGQAFWQAADWLQRVNACLGDPRLAARKLHIYGFRLSSRESAVIYFASQGDGLNLEPSFSILKCVLVTKSVLRFSGSCTIVVTISQESPLGSLVRS